MDYTEEKMQNTVKSDFGNDSYAYFQKLIDEEKTAACWFVTRREYEIIQDLSKKM